MSRRSQGRRPRSRRGFLGDPAPEEQAARLDGRAARSREGRLTELLGKAGTTAEVLPGDEIPEDWLQARGWSDDAEADDEPG